MTNQPLHAEPVVIGNAPNNDALFTARAIVAQAAHPAHRGHILEGRWDNGTLIGNALREVLMVPVIEEGSE